MQLCKSLGREHLRTRRFTNRQRQARHRKSPVTSAPPESWPCEALVERALSSSRAKQVQASRDR